MVRCMKGSGKPRSHTDKGNILGANGTVYEAGKWKADGMQTARTREIGKVHEGEFMRTMLVCMKGSGKMVNLW